MNRPRLKEVLDTLHEALHSLDAREQEVSLALYRLLARGEPVSTGSLARATGADRGRIESLLSAWPGVYRDAEGRVIGFWGLTISKMRHRLLVDGVPPLYAWCAWDTLFLPEILDRAACVESSCPVTGAPIALRVAPEGVQAEGERPLVSFILPDPQKTARDVVTSFCHYVHFFAGERAAQDWARDHPGTMLASLDEAWALGRERNARLYPGRRFSAGARPARRASR